jgi:hypothetical protein
METKIKPMHFFSVLLFIVLILVAMFSSGCVARSSDVNECKKNVARLAVEVQAEHPANRNLPVVVADARRSAGTDSSVLVSGGAGADWIDYGMEGLAGMFPVVGGLALMAWRRAKKNMELAEQAAELPPEEGKELVRRHKAGEKQHPKKQPPPSATA